jgi:hypothetical protein
MKHPGPVPEGTPRKRRRFGRAQDNPSIDSYKLKKKLHEPTSCPSCGCIYADGRWRWPHEEVSTLAHKEICPACHRVEDNYPAGVLTMRSPLLSARHQEVLALVRNVEKAERGEHCQNRIMAIEEPEKGALVVTTTDIHLPQRIGEAMRHAYHGNLETHYDEDSYFVRVEWQRAG